MASASSNTGVIAWCIKGVASSCHPTHCCWQWRIVLMPLTSTTSPARCTAAEAHLLLTAMLVMHRGCMVRLAQVKLCCWVSDTSSLGKHLAVMSTGGNGGPTVSAAVCHGWAACSWVEATAQGWSRRWSSWPCSFTGVHHVGERGHWRGANGREGDLWWRYWLPEGAVEVVVGYGGLRGFRVECTSVTAIVCRG